jgi:flavodoxin
LKALVIYDSKYGNTERIARAIADGIGGEARHFGDVDKPAVAGYDLIVAGSPTQGGRPTTALNNWLYDLPGGSLKGTEAAAFDTRFDPADRGVGLRLLMRVIGFAAPKVAKALRVKGAREASPPEGFIVMDTEGPLREGELERAKAWGEALARSASRAPAA